jgi:hypothetical protein
MAIAAATDTPPELDDALGVAPAPPSPPVPAALERFVACVRWLETCESTDCVPE